MVLDIIDSKHDPYDVSLKPLDCVRCKSKENKTKCIGQLHATLCSPLIKTISKSFTYCIKFHKFDLNIFGPLPAIGDASS